MCKICVYAICKNESKFIDRWVNSIKDEADYIVVLDTGSTDDTISKLKSYDCVKVESYDYIKNDGSFRFDKARNDSMKLIPNDSDICFVLDLDQVPRPGWSKQIKKAYNDGYKIIKGYIIDHDDNGNESGRWASKNVHHNSPFWIWERIIHEGIEYFGKNPGMIKEIFLEDFIIDHFPDNKKDRSGYLKMLKAVVEDDPSDPYFGIYYGVELSKYGRIEEACDAFKRCLEECDFSNQKDIKYQCYVNLGNLLEDPDERLDALYEAEESGLRTRRLYNSMANVYEDMNMPEKAVECLLKALTEVKSYSSDWKDDIKYFEGFIEDRLSLFYYYQLNNPIKSIEYCAKALSYNPTDERLLSNLEFYYNSFKGE